MTRARTVEVQYVTDPAGAADVAHAYALIERVAYRGVSGASDIALASRRSKRPGSATVVGLAPARRPGGEVR